MIILKDLTMLYICKAHLMNCIKRLDAKHNASKDIRILVLGFMAKTIALLMRALIYGRNLV